MISCQLAVYPLGVKDYGGPIKAAIAAVAAAGVEHTVGDMSTEMRAEDEEAIFRALRAAYQAAAAAGDVVVVATISNCCV